jgi:hypothetical protein
MTDVFSFGGCFHCSSLNKETLPETSSECDGIIDKFLVVTELVKITTNIFIPQVEVYYTLSIMVLILVGCRKKVT